MRRTLKKIKDKKLYAEINFDDMLTICGFVTHLDTEDGYTFDIATLEQVTRQNGEEDVIVIEATFGIDSVSNVVHDISHRVPPDDWKLISFMRDEQIFIKKPKAAKPVKKRKSTVLKKVDKAKKA